MADLSDPEGLDRDLGRVARRISRQGFEPRGVLRRLRRAQRRFAIAAAAWALLAIAAGLMLGSWLLAAALALFLLPDRVRAFRARSAQLAALTKEGELLGLERGLLEDQLLRLRMSIAGDLVLAALFAGVGSLTRVPHLFWLLAAAIAGIALARGGMLVPPLMRELRDLGGAPCRGVLFTFLLALMLVAAPFLVVAGMIARGLRRLLGRSDGGAG